MRSTNDHSNNRRSNNKEAFKEVIEHIPGLALVSIVTIGSILLQSTTLFSKIIPLSSLLIAIIIGMIIKNTINLPTNTQKGIKFSSKKILKLAIIFLGFKLSINEVLNIGWDAIVVILFCSTLTLVFTIWIGKTIKVPIKRALLVGSGVSICGASAIAAVDAVIQAEEEDVAFSIGAIALFGTIYMFGYPILYTLFHMPDQFYALWTGISIHEVAQVAAASTIAAGKFEEMATTVKMIRVLFIIPVTLILSFIPLNSANDKNNSETKQEKKVTIPWFAVLFFLMILINTIFKIPAPILKGLVTFDNLILTAAMAGLGLDISFKSMKSIGARAFLLGAISSLFISIISGVVVKLVT
ncbi:Uncharacterized protein family UPF0324 [Caldicellulosiruptor hydrothermalis 108]|uniref:Uncharacterized protein family UPF0324 n=1 Tax=Caldicellulosiruptor hydrothermalis (strain DSM 18901 / VKM B-2411 / 108) TaxID=632292 RepID=E4Q9P5_CALH1|nr:YeiH family protein [Caldicellulosiruptor hydrothermalis]ADQ08150.1 Uncharacterized protein family UPF0324 [Caldicellulosiruptor hydrothermalis 108]